MKTVNRSSIPELFEYHHNRPPPAFNPEFIPWANDVSTLCTHQCYIRGVYDNPSREDRASQRRVIYDELMLLGKPNANDVKQARKYIYDL